MDDRRRLHIYLLLAAMPLFYASNQVIGRYVVLSAPPVGLAFWRWAIAFALLLPFCRRGLRVCAPALRAEWRSLLLLGFLGMVVCGAVVYEGLRYTTATNGTLIFSAAPVAIVILDWLWRGRRMSVVEGIGVAAALVGVTTIICRGDPDVLFGFRFNSGDLGMVAGALAWSVYSLVLKRPALQALPTLPLFAAIAGTGALLLAPGALLEGLFVGGPPARGDVWLGILGLAVVPSLLAFLSFQIGVKAVGPSLTGLFAYLMPIYGVLMAVIFLGESFEPYHAAGMGLTVSGVVLATAQGAFRRLRRAARA